MKQINFRLIMGVAMVLIYLGMAGLIFFSHVFDNFSNSFGDAFKIIIGTLFLVYGIFRGYRIYKDLGGGRFQK